MIRAATTFMLASVLTLQTARPLPRLGAVGQKLTTADLDQIIGLVRATGQELWLVDGSEGFMPAPTRWSVRAYLTPTVTNAQLRRGQILTFSSAGVAGGGRQPWWRQEHVESWAQVAMAGRSLDDVSGDRDVNRPFVVHGELTDDEIVSVVAFIRSGAPLTSSSGSREIFRQVKGDWPVSQLIRRADGMVEARLSEYQYSGQSVTLRQADGQWVLTGLSYWISG